jgi:hypothetical protein
LAAALCAGPVLGCSTWARVPPAQVSRLLSARTAEIEVTDIDGDRVTISRSEVTEVKLEVPEGWRLMTPGPGAGAPYGQVIAVHRSRVEEGKRRGWTTLPEFEDPLQLHLHGEMLTARDKTHEASVSLRVIDHVAVKEPSYGNTAAVILLPILGVVVAGMTFATLCDGCLSPTGPPR